MARLFDDAASEYLERTEAVLTGTPITVACWFRSDAVVDQFLVGLHDTSATPYIALNAWSDGVLYATVRDAATFSEAATSTSWAVNTWHHGCGIFASATSRSVYLDGGGLGTNATSRTATGIDTTCIGVRANSGTHSEYMSGRIAEAAIWNVALTGAEVAILAAGYSPLLVRPQSLVAYWPLIQTDNDRVGGYNLTAYNTPTIAAHPRVLYPAPPMAMSVPVTAPAVRIPRYGFTNFQVPGTV